MEVERTYEFDDQAFNSGPERDEEPFTAAIMVARNNLPTAERPQAYHTHFNNLRRPGALFEMFGR